tara:strand:+ start:72 stop:386 length:315 start_codon:yes stop_codon:yes gene_type:complete
MNKITNILNYIIKFLTIIKIVDPSLPLNINMVRVLWSFIGLHTIGSIIYLNIVNGWLGWSNLTFIIMLLILLSLYKLNLYIIKRGLVTALLKKLVTKILDKIKK